MVFCAATGALVWVGDRDAESYGNRLLGAPRPDECRLARSIVRDFAELRSAELRRAAGAGERKLELLAYAWTSVGAQAPPGADWRWCPGFGPYVRGLGLERMGGGRLGPLALPIADLAGGAEPRRFGLGNVLRASARGPQVWRAKLGWLDNLEGRLPALEPTRRAGAVDRGRPSAGSAVRGVDGRPCGGLRQR